jgi:hypothetical protein
VVVRDTPSESVVVGVPGRVRHRDSLLQAADPERDLQHNILPDATAEALKAFSDRMMALEREIMELRSFHSNGNGHLSPPPVEWTPDKYLGPFGI